MKASTLNAFFSTLAGVVTIIQIAVLANAHFHDPWVWVVPTIFAVLSYMLGRINGTTTTNATANVQTNQLADELARLIARVPADGKAVADVKSDAGTLVNKLQAVGTGAASPA